MIRQNLDFNDAGILVGSRIRANYIPFKNHVVDQFHCPGQVLGQGAAEDCERFFDCVQKSCRLIAGNGLFVLFPAATRDHQHPDTFHLGAILCGPPELGCYHIPESLQITLYTGCIGKMNQAGCVFEW